MRSQVYEWSNVGGNSTRRTAGDAGVGTVASGVDLDIFIGGQGNNITKPAETTATQFVVIEDVSCSPQLAGALQIRINTTDYFQNPDVTDQAGIPGLASPYPRGAQNASTTSFTPDTSTDDNTALLASFNLYPDVYVLPGQTWTVLYRPISAAVAATDGVAAFVKYTLYDGPDALIANKLLEMGVTVNPNNVDWYKRTLIEQQSAAAMAATAAAANGGGQ